jgi:DNA-binding CsgD family transcriptional regulator
MAGNLAGSLGVAAMLELIGDVFGLLDLDEFRTGLLRALLGAVAADWISLNDIGPDPNTTVVLVEPRFPPAAHALFARYAHQNPLLERYRRTGDGRALRFSDVTTTEQLKSTDLYREFYGPIGLRHQLAFALPGEPDRTLAIAMSRKANDFTDTERDLLNTSRPFLIQAYSNAVEYSRLKSELQLRSRGPALPLGEGVLLQALRDRGVSKREAEVLGCIATGASNRQAGEALGVSERTIQKHLQHCFSKLGVHSRAEAISLAWDLAGRQELN